MHRFVAANTFAGGCTVENTTELMPLLFAFHRAFDLSLLGSGTRCCGLDTEDAIAGRVEYVEWMSIREGDCVRG